MAKLRSVVSNTVSCQMAAVTACGTQLSRSRCEVCTGRQQHALHIAQCTASDLQRFCSTGSVQRSSGGPVLLVAWEHVNIQWLTEDLGVPSAQIPTWPDSDYDTVYVLEFDSAAERLTDFQVAAQNFSLSSGIR